MAVNERLTAGGTGAARRGRLRMPALGVMIGLAAVGVSLLGSAAPSQAARATSGRAAAGTALPGGLTGVSADSSTDAWAVGGPLILHWNGTAWSKFTDPVPTADLNAVKAISASDAWAAGQYCPTGACATLDTLILHWNGTAWSKVASPSPGGPDFLTGLSASSATNAWAVGSSGAGYPTTLILHWNGTTWSRVSSPNPGGSNGDSLSAVTAASATSAWAAGDYTTSTGGRTMLLLRWNGTAWSQVTGPSLNGWSDLFGASATSSTSAWAAGENCVPGCYRGGVSYTLIEHWNGTSWSHVSSPNPGGSNGDWLNAVTARSATDAWAVGAYGTSAGAATLIEHWNGTAWSQSASPSPSSTLNILTSVTATSGTSAWAVGTDRSSSNTEETLILRWNGRTWSRA